MPSRHRNAEPLSARSKGRRAASYTRVRDAISAGDPSIAGAGHDFTGSVNRSDVTPAGRAFSEIAEIANAALQDAARDIVLADAVKRAPLLGAAGPGTRAGRVGGDQGGTIGELRRSGKAEESAPGVAEISFNTIYAALQHERMDWKHTDGQAKYLEDAMLHTRDEVAEFIASRIREVVGD